MEIFFTAHYNAANVFIMYE